MTDSRTVRFLVQGRVDTDKVTNMSLEKDVGDLREAIWKQSFHTTDDIIASDLILWKVRHIEILSNHCSLGNILTGHCRPGNRQWFSEPLQNREC
jgi:hypothetical protein